MSVVKRRKRRQGRQQWKKDDSDYDSDDPRSYKNEENPDPTADGYFHDEVDEFHQQREKILLDVDQTVKRDKGSDNEEEVLGWEDDNSDLEEKAREFAKHHRVDEMASDLEEDGDSEDQLTDDRAWGQRKKAFHGADFIGDNVIDSVGKIESGPESERHLTDDMGGDEQERASDRADIVDKLQKEEEEEQVAEEKEARLIQRRMAEALDEGDFDMDTLQTTEPEVEETEVPEITKDIVKKDLSKLSKREKLEILKKESPEMLELIEDCKAKLQEVKDRLQPLIDRVKAGKLPSDTLGVTYLRTKYHLYLNYCLNINFYMVLKARHIPVKNHPVIGRILSYRRLINELKPADDLISGEMEQLLADQGTDSDKGTTDVIVTNPIERLVTKKRKMKKREQDKKLSSLLDDEGEEEKKQKKKKKSGDRDMTEDELKALEYYKKMEAEQLEKKTLKRDLYPEEGADDEGEEMDDAENAGDLGALEGGEDEEAKRAITYQISKNKGLTVRKKKELRNPRVKHRNKFRKAKIRRRGQVVEARTEINRYGGEMGGIRASVVKSTKLK